MIKKIILSIGLFLIVLVLFGVTLLWWISPGKTALITDKQGNELANSIATIEKPSIGGLPQGLIIRGANKNNPVLLFLHGGPGTPAYSLISEEFKQLERIFTICYWEQRGAGMSYSKDMHINTLTLSQLVEDAADVTRYLQQKFNQDKIYILGHSWGSFLASFVIHKYPHLYHAYLGIGQMANTYKSEQLSYQFVLEEAKRRKDEKALEELKKLKLPTPTASSQEWYAYLMKQRQYVSKYGGANYRNPLTLAQRGKALLLCQEYTLREKLNYKAGVEQSISLLWKTVLENALIIKLNEQYIPVYLFAGVHDYQTSYQVANEYFTNLQAPLKKFYTFPNAAHWLFLEDYITFEKIIREDVLGQSHTISQTYSTESE